ncbi:hypothetical protein IW262DRAFT_1482779 [Armillaria fumosa]|nr:hypothetical protein IW262DRAFT_1482779 [Armillaria fumosa]
MMPQHGTYIISPLRPANCSYSVISYSFPVCCIFCDPCIVLTKLYRCSLNLSVTRLYRRSRVTSAAVKQMFKGANDDDEAEEEGQDSNI